ncbi:MAG: hypothetical protein IJ088_10890 [Clostridia bacterium]|nr:hypothetical protein [Clostridia bacterium]
MLRTIIRNRSKNSYLERIPEMDIVEENVDRMSAFLQYHLKEKWDVTLDELQSLDTIYLVTISGKRFLSDIDEDQQALLKKIHVCLSIEA